MHLETDVKVLSREEVSLVWGKDAAQGRTCAESVECLSGGEIGNSGRE